MTLLAFVAAVFVAVSQASCHPLIGGAPLSADPESVARLLDRYAEQHDAWEVWYEIDDPGRERLRRRIAQRSGGFYLHHAAKAPPGADPVDDPRRQRLFIADGRVVIEWPHRGAAQVYRPEARTLPGTAPDDILFFVTGWWCDPEWSPARSVNGSALVFRDLADRQDYVIAAERELVHGRPAVVLEGRTGSDDRLLDRLWVAHDGRHGLLRRQIVARGTGEILQAMEVERFAETGGLIYPELVAIRRRDGASGTSRSVTLRVTRCAVNDEVHPSIFRAEIDEDTLIYDGGSQLVGVTDEDGSHATDIAKWSLRWAGQMRGGGESVRPASADGRDRRLTDWLIPAVLGAAAGFVLAGLPAWSRSPGDGPAT